MKALTFNQLQIRIFILILILFTGAVMSYRVFIERPMLKENILNVVQKELKILNYSAKRYLNSLNSINYDYAVWEQTYEYIENLNTDYINENYINDTFVSLKFDGVVIFNESLDAIFTKGYHHKKRIGLKFNFYNFDTNPQNQHIFPLRAANQKVAQRSGMLETQHGPALFSITEIKRSDRTGEKRGFILFLKLFNVQVIEEIERYTMTTITTQRVTNSNSDLNLLSWTTDHPLNEIPIKSQRYIQDIHQAPLILLTINHNGGVVPPLLDNQSLIFILLFTVIIFIVYSLMSYTIIRPVKLLTADIKKIDENEKAKFLDDSYKIKELDSVAHHFNELMDTISHQKALLSQQANTDALTKISNRRQFEIHLEKQFQLFVRSQVSFTVIIADVDYFKRFNDHLGHIEGDEALIKVANTLSHHFKRRNDLCARYGGEEFIMLYSDMDPAKLAEKLAEILASFTALNLPHPTSLVAPYLTVSLGACIVTVADNTTQILSQKTVIRAADHALYNAKKNGRNNYEIITLNDYINDVR